MEELSENNLTCDECGQSVNADDDFCPRCGSLFIDDVFCENHSNVSAEGVCIVCSKPYCSKCGFKTSGHFLCNHHGNYEIFEGMVRVYGVLDDLAAQYASSCLEQAGLHPVIFCRDQPKGGPRFVYTLYEAAGDFDGHVINEIKVMVPCQEVLEAEETLRSFNILK
jgi:hypothetical protein